MLQNEIEKYMKKLEDQGLVEKPYEVQVTPLPEQQAFKVRITEKPNVDKIVMNLEIGKEDEEKWA